MHGDDDHYVAIWKGEFDLINADCFFLDASSHLYKRACLSVGPSVENAFVKLEESDNLTIDIHRQLGPVGKSFDF